MSAEPDLTEVAVYTEDGRYSLLATLHGWLQKEDGWWGHVMVYGPRTPEGGGGQYRDLVHEDRLVPLIYCGRVPGEIRHRCEGSVRRAPEDRVWS